MTASSMYLKKPAACTEKERQEFESLVRQGFGGSDGGLPARMATAKRLAFYYPEGGRLAGIAALKMPREQDRDDIFKKAEAHVRFADYRLELGWIFVVPDYRGNGLAELLCRRLLEDQPGECVYATTRCGNIFMIRILLLLGFSRVGRPFPRRKQELELYLRPAPAAEESGSSFS